MLFNFDDSRRQQAEPRHSKRCARVDAVQGLRGLCRTIRELNAELPGNVRQSRPEALCRIGVQAEFFLEIRKRRLDAAALLLCLGQGFFHLIQWRRHFFNGVCILIQLALHFAELRLGVVQRDLPAVGLLAAFAVLARGVLQGFLQLFDLLLLRQNAALKNIILLRQRLDAPGVVAKLLRGKIQFGLQDL